MALEIQFNCNFCQTLFLLSFLKLLFSIVFWIFINTLYRDNLLETIKNLTDFDSKAFVKVLFTTFGYGIMWFDSFLDDSDKIFVFFLNCLILLFELKYFTLSIEFHVDSWNLSEWIMPLIINQFVPFFRKLFALLYRLFNIPKFNHQFISLVSLQNITVACF